MVQTTRVSIKVWVMEISAWVTGCFVWAAAQLFVSASLASGFSATM
jgi:hypothetical protein